MGLDSIYPEVILAHSWWSSAANTTGMKAPVYAYSEGIAAP